MSVFNDERFLVVQVGAGEGGGEAAAAARDEQEGTGKFNLHKVWFIWDSKSQNEPHLQELLDRIKDQARELQAMRAEKSKVSRVPFQKYWRVVA